MWKLVLFFHCVDSGDQRQVVRLGGQTTLVTEPTCPDEELLIEGYEKTVGAKLWAP